MPLRLHHYKACGQTIRPRDTLNRTRIRPRKTLLIKGPFNSADFVKLRLFECLCKLTKPDC
jgi:hypothetical protein